MILDRMGVLDFDQRTEDLIDVDDKVVVLVRWVRERAITSVEFFLDRAEALQAVGLRE